MHKHATAPPSLAERLAALGLAESLEMWVGRGYQLGRGLDPAAVVESFAEREGRRATAYRLAPGCLLLGPVSGRPGRGR